MKVLSVVMTHGQRSKAVRRAVDNIRAFSVPSEIFIWNNGPHDVAIEGVRVVNGVNECGEVQKLTLPLVLDGYDITFYCDDDLMVHDRFLERSIRLLDLRPGLLVCTGGSLVEGEDPGRRRWVPASSFPSRPFYADLGDLGCFVLRSENVRWMLASGRPVPRPWGFADIFFSASYWEQGGCIYVPEQPDDSRLCLRPRLEHFHGLCAEPGFVRRRNQALRALWGSGWRPAALARLDPPPVFWS